MSWDPHYCEQSEHQRKIHGVLRKDRSEDKDWIWGICCYCQQKVRAPWYSKEPWSAYIYLIEEEPV